MKTGLHIFFLIILVLSIWVSLSSAGPLQLDFDWKKCESDHFIIYYHPNIPEKDIGEFTRACEHCYHLICERLGFKRFNFWRPTEKTKISVFASKQAYLKFVGQPEYASAYVSPAKNFLRTYYLEEDFFDSILPHQLTPAILEEFTGLKTAGPIWFRQGLAWANERNSYPKYLLLAKGFLEKETYLPIAEMERMDQQEIDSSTVFYAVAASCVIYLLEEYDKDCFVQLCRQLRNWDSFYKAMDKAYAIKDAESLNEKFLTFLNSRSCQDIAARQGSSVKW